MLWGITVRCRYGGRAGTDASDGVVCGLVGVAGYDKADVRGVDDGRCWWVARWVRVTGVVAGTVAVSLWVVMGAAM